VGRGALHIHGNASHIEVMSKRPECTRWVDPHVIYRPGPPLDGFVDLMWAVSMSYVASTPRERVLPTGAPSLVVNLGAEPLRIVAGNEGDPVAPSSDVGGAVLCGARTRSLVIDTTTIAATVGVQFKSGGARPFFGVPADAVAERAVSLEALWGTSARLFREQLLGASTPLAQLQILEATLRGHARGALQRPPALPASLAAFDERALPSVAEVNRRTGMSPKRLIALFREEVGLSPKAFWRVRRFQRALSDLTCGRMSGAELALANGYCDQSHFLREFRALAGSNPREYLDARVGDSGHVAIHG
jgi:AraC-like DNA-binding protein